MLPCMHGCVGVGVHLQVVDYLESKQGSKKASKQCALSLVRISTDILVDSPAVIGSYADPLGGPMTQDV